MFVVVDVVGTAIILVCTIFILRHYSVALFQVDILTVNTYASILYILAHESVVE